MSLTVRFTTVGWTDSGGSGWKKNAESRAGVASAYWEAATSQRGLVPHAPEEVGELTGIPVWSLAEVSVDGDPYWCFGSLTRGTQHLAGTLQFAFAPIDLPATAVWWGAAMLLGSDDHGEQNRFPWGTADIPVERAPAGHPLTNDDAGAAEALIGGLLKKQKHIGVPVDPAHAAELIPRALAVIPASTARSYHWFTCLLRVPDLFGAMPGVVLGRWSQKMRDEAARTGSTDDQWIDRVVPRSAGPLTPEQRVLVNDVCKNVLAGIPLDLYVARDARSVELAYDRAVDAWRHDSADIADLIVSGQWEVLRKNLGRVQYWATQNPTTAAEFVGTKLRFSDVAQALVLGLWPELANMDGGHHRAVADALQLPGPGITAPETNLHWLGTVVKGAVATGEIDALVSRLTEPGRRWAENSELVAAGPLLLAMGISAQNKPALFPFDPATTANEIGSSDGISDAIAARIRAQAAPLAVVARIADLLPKASLRALAQLLVAALSSPAPRPGDWHHQVWQLVREWMVRDRGRHAAARLARFLQFTKTEITATLAQSTATPETGDPTAGTEAGAWTAEQAATDQATIFDAVLSRLPDLSISPETLLRVGTSRNAVPMTVATYVNELPGLRPATAAFLTGLTTAVGSRSSDPVPEPNPVPPPPDKRVLVPAGGRPRSEVAVQELVPKRWQDLRENWRLLVGIVAALLVLLVFIVGGLYLVISRAESASGTGAGTSSPTSSPTSRVVSLPSGSGSQPSDQRSYSPDRVRVRVAKKYDGKLLVVTLSNVPGDHSPEVLAVQEAAIGQQRIQAIRGKVTSGTSSGTYVATVTFAEKLDPSGARVWVIPAPNPTLHQLVTDVIDNGKEPKDTFGRDQLYARV